MSVSNTTKHIRTKYFSERASVLIDLGYLGSLCKVRLMIILGILSFCRPPAY